MRARDHGVKGLISSAQEKCRKKGSFGRLKLGKAREEEPQSTVVRALISIWF